MTAEFTSEDEWEQETELVEQSLDLIRDADVHISLNALQGVAGGNTLQMTCLIKKQPVPFLMDTGNTHNFFSAKWVKSLGLKSQSIKIFPVMIASDKQMVITRSCTQVEWRFGDQIFQADFLVLPSSIFGVILGM